MKKTKRITAEKKTKKPAAKIEVASSVPPIDSIRYFLSYAAIAPGMSVFGNVDYTAAKPINTIEDIREIEKAIADLCKLQNPLIISWQRFDK